MGKERIEGRWPSGMPDVVPGKFIVRLAPDAVPRAPAAAAGPGRAAVRAALATLPEPVRGAIESLARNAGLRSVSPLFSSPEAGARLERASPGARLHLATLSSVQESSSEELAGFAVLDVDAAAPAAAAVATLRGARAFQIVEPMPARWTSAVRTADPRRNAQWGLRATEWFEAPRPRASGVTVAVLDTGVDAGHPELKGVVDAYETGTLSKEDIVGHGTHVAGIVAASSDNGVGVTGFCDARLKVWKVFEDAPHPVFREFLVNGNAYLNALRAVEVSGARVLNLSLGGTRLSETEVILFRRLARKGVVVVAAMGNEHERGNPVEYPAAYGEVLGVGALDPAGRRARFSNTGPHIGICAPGVGIWSTLPRKASRHRGEKGYAAWDGTSMAAPHVAAAAALLLAKHPGWSAAEVRERLRGTATRLGEMGSRKFTEDHGSGLLNLRAALARKAPRVA